MEKFAVSVCFLIRYGVSIVLVTPPAILLSIIVDIEWEIGRLAVSVNFSNGVVVPVVFHFDGQSTKAVIVFVVVGGIVRARSVMTGCRFVVVSLEAVLTCICQVREMNEAVCRVNDYTDVPHGMEPSFWSC